MFAISGFFTVLCLGLFADGTDVACAQSAPQLFPDEATPRPNRDNSEPIQYYGVDAIAGKIVLNANNGYFDKGAWQALGKLPAPAEDKGFISAHFSHLQKTGDSPNGRARWHFWTAEAGTVDVEFYLRVPASENSFSWKVKLNDDAQIVSFSTSQSEQATAQTVTVGYDLKTQTS